MSAVAGEPVRLVIWDLDETFWRGTLSEGGISEYIDAHHEIVIDLARRGIISSICSRNDFDAVRDVLVPRGLWDYFVFPSVDWSAKPARVRAIVEAAQLRPETVLFIDDNPSNRAAVAADMPALRVASETFIAEIPGHALFKGRPDEGLTRLKQYKLLETRAAERDLAADPKAFLRASGIRVEIVSDLKPHLERIVELVNRTNQLNFTKKRFSEDTPTAIRQLKDLIAGPSPWVNAGLVRVRDNYGDYGYCGFYAQTGDRLEHFCFSCRVLGFGVESWVYAKLGRPAIEGEGEVLVNLKAGPKVDWITAEEPGAAAPAASQAGDEAVALRLRGRCEVGLLTQYLRFAGVRLVSEGAYREGGLELFSDSAVNLYYTSGRRWERLRPEFEKIGFAGYPGTKIFDGASAAAPVLFFAHRDFMNRPYLYRHKSLDLVVSLTLTHFSGDLVACDFAELVEHVRAREPMAERAESELLSLARLRESYVSLSATGEDTVALVKRALRGLIDDLQADAKLMPVLMHPEAKDAAGAVWRFAEIADSRKALLEAFGDDPRVDFLDVSACIQSPDELVDWFHYDRVVYHRMARLAVESCWAPLQRVALRRA